MNFHRGMKEQGRKTIEQVATVTKQKRGGCWPRDMAGRKSKLKELEETALGRADDLRACAWESANDGATREAANDRYTCALKLVNDGATRDGRLTRKSVLIRCMQVRRAMVVRCMQKRTTENSAGEPDRAKLTRGRETPWAG
jgi:hypothetical protein